MKRTLLLALLTAGLAYAEPKPPEPVTPQSFVKLRYIRDGAARPDGSALAYTVSSDTPQDPRFDRQRARSHSALWLFEKGESRELLGDATYPSWSHDGSMLAALQLDSNQARLKVWDAGTRKWSVLRHAVVGRGDGSGYQWLPDQRILVQTEVEKATPQDVVVLDSVEKDLAPRHQLLDWNPQTGTIREWGQGTFLHVAPDPGGKRLATWRQDRLPFPSGKAAAPCRLVICELGNRERVIEGVVDPVPQTLRWSDSGQQLAVSDARGQWWQVESGKGEARMLPAGIKDCAWVGETPILRGDSWALSGRAVLPGSARIFSGPKEALAVDQGQLLRLSEQGQATPVQAIPGQGTLVWEQSSEFPLVVRRGNRRTRIGADGSMRTSGVESDHLLTASGGGLWLVNAEHSQVRRDDGQPGPRLDSLLSQATLASVPAASGQVDWVLRPADPQTRHAVVLWLEPGRVYTADTPPAEAVLSNQASGLNGHLLTSQGYAVYYPSISVAPGQEPAQAIQQGLQAALTRLRSQADLDPSRIAVMGRGYGGYGALLSLTQGAPFRTAVVVNPIVDLGGDYARLPVTSQDALERTHARSYYYETALGAAPWDDPQRYLRNSPYYLADRVKSPVLLISGGQDEHQAQAEQFFQALYRQGKPARLVRYQDEPNYVGQARHVEHQWDQIYSWLARYLGSNSRAQR